MKKLIALLGCCLLVACSQDDPTIKPPVLNFASQPLRINVAQMRVDQNYQSPGMKPNVEQDFTVSPATAVELWASQRLQEVGNSGLVVVSVEDASVRATPAPKKDGIKQYFADEEVRYDAKLKATIRLYDGVTTISRAEAHVEVSRGKSLKADASAAERNQFYDRLTQELMAAFDAQATTQIRQYFSGYLQ